MNEPRGRKPEVVDKAKVRAQRECALPACRTILIAACMGVLIGLLLKP